METWLATETAGVEQGTLVRVVGEVDIATLGNLCAALEAAVPLHSTVIVDLAGVTFLSLAGARELAQMQNRLASAGRRLVLWRPHRSPEHALRLTELDGKVVVHHGPLAALG